MKKSRLEAFSDGVIAILITIMVLELKVPHDATFHALAEMWPVLLSYLLSFVLLGIYWNNHHHLLHATDHISGGAMWANNHLLFWLSLVPFVTAWMGENNWASVPTAMYGVVLLGCAISYSILVRTLLARRGENPRLAAAIGGDAKGYLSLALYAAAVPLAFVYKPISYALYVLVALIWLIPDTRIERHSHDQPANHA
jgi:uncharacterized membrane protein